VLFRSKEDGANPRKSFSGKFSLRIPPDLHGMIATKAASSNTSISAWVIDALKEKVHHE
jgi:predicted HicB family RNase H-like nuclease